jgi:hypothetical protein
MKHTVCIILALSTLVRAQWHFTVDTFELYEVLSLVNESPETVTIDTISFDFCLECTGVEGITLTLCHVPQLVPNCWRQVYRDSTAFRHSPWVFPMPDIPSFLTAQPGDTLQFFFNPIFVNNWDVVCTDTSGNDMGPFDFYATTMAANVTFHTASGSDTLVYLGIIGFNYPDKNRQMSGRFSTSAHAARSPAQRHMFDAQGRRIKPRAPEKELGPTILYRKPQQPGSNDR